MSGMPEREDRPGREDDGPVGPAAASLGGCGQREHAEHEEANADDDENDSETARLRMQKRDAPDPRNADTEDQQVDAKRKLPEGEPEKWLQQPGIVEVGHGAVSAAVAVGAILGCVVLFPAERALVQALVLLAAYPCFGALFYVGYRRWGRALGAPPQFGAVCYALALASWFLMVSGDAVVQRGAFWLAQTGLVLSGVSIGCGLAMVAAALDTDFRGAVRAAREADRAATRRLRAGGSR